MKLGRRSFIAAACGVALSSVPLFAGVRTAAPENPDRLIVHEWGTFTVLQDEDGKPIGGINTDDEPVPGFVHDIAGINRPSSHELPPVYFKAVPRNHGDVYTRLETPVTYFYPPKNFDKPIDVKVTFRQGWLTQYYPDALPGGPDINEEGRLRWGRLGPESSGSLEWRGLRLGGDGPVPETDDKTWLAPRNVKAATVTTPQGERERYLFYRGVGNVPAPLRVSRASDNSLEVRPAWTLPTAATIGPLLLIDARADGTSAFRTIEKVDVSGAACGILETTPGTFSESEYAAGNLAKVREILHRTLVRDGLYDDEATAMLDTWEVSYFKRPGMRLFFSVPRTWTEHYLPLTVSTTADITRVMIGRIEIVTPAQRAALRKIASGPASDSSWVDAAQKRLRATPADRYREEWYTEVVEGRKTLLESLNVTVPADYKAYLSLGRFRNALIIDELGRRPTAELKRFVQNYQLAPYANF